MNETIDKILETGEARLTVNKPMGRFVAELHRGQLHYRGEGETVDEAIAALAADVEELAKASKPATIFEMARDVVAGNGQWSAGQVRRVWKGPRTTVTVGEGGRDGGGLLFLTFSNGRKVRRQCGFLDVAEGRWAWTLTRGEYDAMVAEFGREGK